jgi:hypothetical protein
MSVIAAVDISYLIRLLREPSHVVMSGWYRISFLYNYPQESYRHIPHLSIRCYVLSKVIRPMSGARPLRKKWRTWTDKKSGTLFHGVPLKVISCEDVGCLKSVIARLKHDRLFEDSKR